MSEALHAPTPHDLAQFLCMNSLNSAWWHWPSAAQPSQSAHEACGFCACSSGDRVSQFLHSGFLCSSLCSLCSSLCSSTFGGTSAFLPASNPCWCAAALEASSSAKCLSSSWVVFSTAFLSSSCRCGLGGIFFGEMLELLLGRLFDSLLELLLPLHLQLLLVEFLVSGDRLGLGVDVVVAGLLGADLGRLLDLTGVVGLRLEVLQLLFLVLEGLLGLLDDGLLECNIFAGLLQEVHRVLVVLVSIGEDGSILDGNLHIHLHIGLHQLHRLLFGSVRVLASDSRSGRNRLRGAGEAALNGSGLLVEVLGHVSVLRSGPLGFLHSRNGVDVNSEVAREGPGVVLVALGALGVTVVTAGVGVGTENGADGASLRLAGLRTVLGVLR